MDPDTPVNIKHIPYPLHRAVVNPASQTVTVYCGLLFPIADDITFCGIYFNDGSNEPIIVGPIPDKEYNSMVSAISSFPSFVPNWHSKNNAFPLIPRFIEEYEYSKPGTYRIRCILYTKDNTIYIGTSTVVTVGEPRAIQRSIDIVDDIRNNTTATDIFRNPEGPPIISSDFDEPLDVRLPFRIDFSILNIKPIYEPFTVINDFTDIEDSIFEDEDNNDDDIGGGYNLGDLVSGEDIEYIYWRCNNGQQGFNDFRNRYVEPVEFSSTFSTVFRMLPKSKTISVTALIVFRRDDTLYHYEVTRTINLRNIGNIAVDRNVIATPDIDRLLEESVGIINTDLLQSNNNNDLTDLLHDICVVPATSSTLPVTTTFTFKVKPQLLFILCDFDDGTYEFVPISSFPESMGLLFIAQTIHRYTSINHIDFSPTFLYVYQREDGTHYAERKTLETNLRYSIGVFEQNGNHRLIPISSSTNYRKFNGISTVVSYFPNTNVAVIDIRLSIGTNPKHILSFDKIIWTLNDEDGIIHDKDATKNFGRLRVFTTTPYNRFKVSARVFRKNTNNLIVDEVYNFYDGGAFNILTESDANIQNTRLRIISQQEEFDPSTRLPALDDVVRVLPERLTQEIEEAEYLEDLSTEAQFSGISVLFDRAIEAEAPAANFLNRNFPTIAARESGIYGTAEDIGFIKPSKTSLTILDPGQFTFYLDVDTVEFNKIYYFPDPYKYGSEVTTLVFDVDETSFRKGIGYSFLRDFPSVTDSSITFNGYKSTSLPRLKSQNLSAMYVADSKQDVFGNTYSLFKPNTPFTQNVIVEDDIIKHNINVNGYLLYDVLFNGGYSYDFALSGTLDNIIRTGFTTLTQTLTTDNTRFAVLNFGKLTNEFSFSPTKQPIHVSTQYLNPIDAEDINCGTFVSDVTEEKNEFMSSDLSAFPGNGEYFYTELFEAGVHTAVPYQRPLVDDTTTLTQSITAVFTEELFLSNTGEVLDIDCGKFYTRYNIISDKTLHAVDSFVFTASSTSGITEVVPSTTVPQSIISRKEAVGEIFIKTNRGDIMSVADIDHIADRYGSVVYNELSSIVSFDIVYDTIFMQTTNYFIADRLKYRDGSFVKSGAARNIIEINNDMFNKVSNRIVIGSFVYFVVTKKEYDIETGQVYITPFIYKYCKRFDTFKLLYPLTEKYELDEYHNVTDQDVMYVELVSPRICYNKKTNKINLSYILKDQNGSPTIVSLSFRLGDYIKFSVSSSSKLSTTGKTTLPNTQNFITLFTSNQPTLTNDYLII